ncbi:hypothetical protein MJ580_11015 [Klebsiella pneumoniae]|nr:hypothetical protein MJ580_11015 [Klebsiella pneumoniae]
MKTISVHVMLWCVRDGGYTRYPIESAEDILKEITSKRLTVTTYWTLNLDMPSMLELPATCLQPVQMMIWTSYK